ncbi:MAG: GIY-YIG nuclease family protein [Anaerolineae bacterium]|nr:GIY-YIG nuclease family protein [Anaerolineae bacterium]
MKTYFVYILASKSGNLYTGITSNLEKRISHHKQKTVEGFTAKYNITRLVYFEETKEVQAAVAREKQIKSWRRNKKVELVKSINPKWKDLSEAWHEE